MLPLRIWELFLGSNVNHWRSLLCHLKSFSGEVRNYGCICLYFWYKKYILLKFLKKKKSTSRIFNIIYLCLKKKQKQKIIIFSFFWEADRELLLLEVKVLKKRECYFLKLATTFFLLNYHFMLKTFKNYYSFPTPILSLSLSFSPYS